MCPRFLALGLPVLGLTVICSLQAAFLLGNACASIVSTFQVYGFVAGACSDGFEKTGFSTADG